MGKTRFLAEDEQKNGKDQMLVKTLENIGSGAPKTRIYDAKIRLVIRPTVEEI
jgi:hypothetical protein